MSRIDFNNDNNEYFDVLREIGNIGAGNATSALAQMLGRKVELSVPKVRLLDFKDVGGAIGGEEQIMAGIYLLIEGAITGSMMFLLKKESAADLVAMLMGQPDRDPNAELGEIECSALKEIGNIITSSYLNAISSLTGLTVFPSVPSLCVDMAGAILSVPAIEFGMMCDKLLLIENKFQSGADGYLILVPDIDSYDKIFGALGM
ncbi:MAG: chemotaxis protein CheC [Lachnospiraceae bacterium]|nr:chemotaxis protein CheC [Lachnospiraceae bacterium]